MNRSKPTRPDQKERFLHFTPRGRRLKLHRTHAVSVNKINGEHLEGNVSHGEAGEVTSDRLAVRNRNRCAGWLVHDGSGPHRVETAEPDPRSRRWLSSRAKPCQFRLGSNVPLDWTSARVTLPEGQFEEVDGLNCPRGEQFLIFAVENRWLVAKHHRFEDLFHRHLKLTEELAVAFSAHAPIELDAERGALVKSRLGIPLAFAPQNGHWSWNTEAASNPSRNHVLLASRAVAAAQQAPHAASFSAAIPDVTEHHTSALNSYQPKLLHDTVESIKR